MFLDNIQECFVRSNISLKSNVQSITNLSDSITEQEGLINDIRQKCRIKEKTLSVMQSKHEENKSKLYYQMYEFNSKLPSIRTENQLQEDKIETKLDNLSKIEDNISNKIDKVNKEINTLKFKLKEANNNITVMEDKENEIDQRAENYEYSSGPESEEIEIRNLWENNKDLSEQITDGEKCVKEYENKLNAQRKEYIDLMNEYESTQKKIEELKLNQIKNAQKICREIADAKDSSIIRTSLTNNINLTVYEEKIKLRSIIKSIKKENEELEYVKKLIEDEKEKRKEKESQIEKIATERKSHFEVAVKEKEFNRIKNKHNTLQVVDIIHEKNRLIKEKKNLEDEMERMRKDEVSIKYDLQKANQEIRAEENKRNERAPLEREVKHLEDDFAIEEEDAKVKYEALLILLDQVHQKIAKRMQTQEKLSKYKVKPIDLGELDVKPPKFKFLNEYRAYRLLNKELRSRIEKQKNANKMIEIDLKKVRNDLKATKKKLVTFQQTAIIRDIEKERKDKQEEAEESIFSSKMAIKIAEKIMNIDCAKMEIEAKKCILDKISSEYNMKSKNGDVYIVQDREGAQDKERAKRFVEREFAAVTVSSHLSSLLNGSKEVIQRLNFAKSSVIQKGILEKWNEVLDEHCSEALPPLM